MKTRILYTVMALLLAVPSFAQKTSGHGHNDARHKEMLEFKLKFLADEIDLRDDQKKQFNEIYTQMENERRAAFRKIRNAERTIKSKKDASEEDYEKATNEIAAAREEMAQIEKKYDEKLAAVLTKKQMFKLKDAEKKFQDTMRECRDKKKSEKARKGGQKQ